MPIFELLPAEAHARLAEGTRLVDVRSPQEFAQGFPQGAINLPIFFMGALGMQPNPHFVDAMKKHFKPTDAIAFTCRSGARSMRAAELMMAQGFTGELTNVTGGYHGGNGADGPVVGWADAGLPTSVDITGVSWEDLF
jgi:rhodanese-related sulfurtransferase